MISDSDYREWLMDVSRDPYRILLIEADHSGGTIRLASDHWISDTYEAYDGWIVSEPYLEDSLDSFLGVGDFDAINPDAANFNWLSLQWRGYRCRWYHGDKTWPKSEFKPIATALIDGVRSVNGNVARFDLMDGGQQLNRTFLTADHQSTISAPSTIEYIMDQAGLDPVVVFQNVRDVEETFQVDISMTPDSIALTEITKLTDSMGASMRFSQAGQLEVFIPEITDSPKDLTEDDIIASSINMVELVQPYRKVTCKLSDDTEVSASTGAVTGELDEELIFNTVLRRTVDATKFIDKKALYYATNHIIWQMKVLDVVGLLQVGDDVSINHAELMGVGIVSSIRRAPLSPFSIIEVTI